MRPYVDSRIVLVGPTCCFQICEMRAKGRDLLAEPIAMRGVAATVHIRSAAERFVLVAQR